MRSESIETESMQSRSASVSAAMCTYDPWNHSGRDMAVQADGGAQLGLCGL